ncbi:MULTISPECIES: MBL fold metallo-hydrolase [unclassified Microbacterium]|uniref:MBL fold metallo-hydrolase n=1 Tax=unclassified Microbacterium TaxID=2609290 RepID=UPI0036677D21
MYTYDALVAGFPAKSDSHGAFGWSAVWLIDDGERKVLVDAGGPAYASVLRDALAARGLMSADITDVLLTHAHWDHVSNFTSFDQATVWLGSTELEWASRQPVGAHFLSDVHVQELHRRWADGTGRVRTIEGDDLVLPGIRALKAPGHTPGHLAFLVEDAATPLLLAGDAVKNLHELATGDVDSTLDEAESRRTVQKLRSVMNQAGAALAPGHDVLLVADEGQVHRIAPQHAQFTFFEAAEGPGLDHSVRFA